jgi:hypothetical protein
LFIPDSTLDETNQTGQIQLHQSFELGRNMRFSMMKDQSPSNHEEEKRLLIMILASVLRLEEKISIAFSRLHWLTS